ncbi:hypothetical protein C8R43DRAFT_1142841 [Mycena crocata]|nr:hypothetical protein C8R43DRAFT_1142841 [Mycena crocata]
MCSCGHSVTLSTDEEDLESETELLIQARKRTFQDGLDEGSDEESSSDSVEPGVAVDEDELSSSSAEEDSDAPPIAVLPAKKPVVPAKKKDLLPFDLKFSVPVDGANMTFTIRSTSPYPDLLSLLADTMSLPPKDVRVGYRYSLQARGEPFNHLRNADQLADLVSGAIVVQKTSKSKKDFFIEIKDLRVAVQSKASNKKEEKKKQKRGDSSEEDDSAAGSGEEVDGKKVRLKKMTMPQWVARLEEDNSCPEHGGHGCLKYVTGHVQIGKTDMSTWAIFLTKGYASTTTPPPNLKIARQKEAKTPAAAAAANIPAAPAMPAMPAMPYPADFAHQKYIQIVDPVDVKAGDLTHLILEMEKKRVHRERNHFT